MQPFRYEAFENGKIAIDGPASNKRIVLFIGRSNEQKSSAPLERLLSSLKTEGYTLIWCQSKDEVTAKLLDLKGKDCLDRIYQFSGDADNLVSKGLRRIIKAAILMAYPSRWSYFLSFYREGSISSKVSQYRHLIQSLGSDKEISILAHSAGGRIASLLDNESGVRNLICFGYPFKHPKSNEGMERTRSLKYQRKPFLIIQGRQDEYGGEDVVDRYKLSKSITFQFIDSNHDYELISSESWEIVTRAIVHFLSK